MREVRVLNNHLVFPVTYPEKALAFFPGSKVVEAGGQHYCAAPHTLETARILNNKGLAAPAPILYDYRWPGRFTPYPHQKDTAAFLTMHERCFCLNGMGCIEGDAVARVNRKGKSYPITLRKLYSKFHTMPDKDTWKARSLLGNVYGLNRILDVLYKGEQATLRITLEDGKTFRCTADHHIALPGGEWARADALSVGDTLVTNGKKLYRCPSCGEYRELGRQPIDGVTCRTCMGGRRLGESNPSWTGGRFVDKDGYIRVRLPGHPRANRSGHVYEHVAIMEEALGRAISPGEHVHHINKDKADNRVQNLRLLPPAEHHRLHTDISRLDGAISGKGGVVVAVPKYAKITSIEPGGVTDVYDLCMEGPHHNFVVNGVVVHNSGKTAATLWAADYMLSKGGKTCCLIISPLSTLERVWGDEIFYLLPHRSFAVLHGTRAKRKMMLAEEHDFYIINHDGVATIIDDLREREDIDLVIVDEVASFRNHRTAKFKILDALLNKTGVPKAAWGLTGTPTPEAPTDAYGQAKLIVPEKTRGLYFNTFKSQVMFQINMYRWAPKHGSEAKVKELLSPSIRYALEDCVDLPETIIQFRECELSPMQQKHYKELVNEAVTEINGTDISAVNAAVLVNKLHQASCGVVYGNNGEIVRLDFGPRLALLEEVISECDQKVIVFVPFTGALRVLQETLRKKWTVEVVDGSTPKGKRNQIFHDFQHTPEPHILLANAGTMAHGLTLTAASTIVWYAPCNSNDIYNQANARIVRPGQKNVTNIVNIYGTSLEMKTYKSLKEKTRLQDVLLSLAKEERKT